MWCSAITCVVYNICVNRRAPVADDARKYLVISPSWMSVNGMECDKIGVQPRAFYEQPERCYRPLGSCLGGGRQPVQLLRETSSSGYRERGERLLVEDYVRGTEIRFDGVSKQMVVDGRVSPRHEAETAQDDGVSVRGVSEIVLDDNAVIYDKYSSFTVERDQAGKKQLSNYPSKKKKINK